MSEADNVYDPLYGSFAGDEGASTAKIKMYFTVPPNGAAKLHFERRDAGVPASKLRCDEGLGGKTQQGICHLGVYLQRRVQPVHRGEQGGCVRLAEASRAAAVTASKRAVAILESTSEEVSTADCRA